VRSRRQRVRRDRPGLVLVLVLGGRPGFRGPRGRGALAAARRTDRSRERLTAVRSRFPASGRTARDARHGRVRRAAPEHRAATPRAGPRHARGSWAAAHLGGAPHRVEAAHPAATGPREAADPPGPGSLDGQPESRGVGSLEGRRKTRGAETREGQRKARGAGTPEGQPKAPGTGRRRGAGRPRLASSGPRMTWAPGAVGPWGPAAANRGPHPEPGALRPGVRATVARSPGVPPRAARSACREMPRPPRAAGTPPEHLGNPGSAWSPGQRRSRGIVPRRARRLARARRGERRSDHLANTRSSGSGPVPASGPTPGTPPPGAGDRRGRGATRSG
jgi:hypothetical protein